MPLWLLFIFGVLIGIFVGWLACWFAQGKWRKLARDRRDEISNLQSELEAAKQHPATEQAVTPYMGLMP